MRSYQHPKPFTDYYPAVAELNAIDGVTVFGVVHSHNTSYEVTEYSSDGTPLAIKNHAGEGPSKGKQGDKGNDILNQANRLKYNMVKESGMFVGNKNKLVEDMSADAPAFGNTPKKVVSTPTATYYGGDENQVQPISLKDLKRTSKKIEKYESK